MQLFKLKDNNTPKLSRKNMWKRGGYAAAITAAAIVGVILINILFSALGNRVSLKLDLSFTGENSLSQENTQFLKEIETPVSVTVCATKEDYQGGMLSQIAGQYLYVYDESGYYAQTVKLLDMYASVNPKITVEYLDITSTAGQALVDEYPSLFYGDIIVSTTNADGKTTSKLVGFNDIYSYSDSTGYGYSSITANKLETALSSAINLAISGQTKQAALLANYSDTTVFETYFAAQLKLNGIETQNITDNILSSVPEGVEQLYIVCPSKDLLPQELNVINAWLNNNGARGRSLIFVPGTSVANIPNVLEFLSEWGVSYTNGILYETNSRNHMQGDNTTLAAFNNETQITDVLNAQKQCILGHNIPMQTAYESYETKTTNIMVSSADTTVAAPVGIDENWTPDASLTKKSYANLIITADNSTLNNSLVTSYVAAFSSVDFIYSEWATLTQVGNMETAVNTAVKTAGFDAANKKLFIDKSVSAESFADKVSESGTTVIVVLFMVITPLVLIGAGVYVWIRRRNR